jgi:hypothetical protein
MLSPIGAFLPFFVVVVHFIGVAVGVIVAAGNSTTLFFEG